MPGDMYLLPEVDAWVANRGGAMGFGGRRVMAIGLPLMQLLSVSQLEAVIAHEFGHYYGGDTRLGPWIYRTHAAIGRTLANLGGARSSLLQQPFQWYGTVFMRITRAVSRQQEYTADAFAARTVGARPLIEALKRIHGHAGSFRYYWDQFVVPVLSTGYRPAIAEGYARLIGAKGTSQAVTEAVEKEMKEGRADPYDTHPALAERIAALEKLSGGEAEDARSALSLLGEVRQVERLLLGMFVTPESLASLKEISWEDVGEKVYVHRWKQMQAANASLFMGLTAVTIPDVFARFGEFGPKVVRADGGSLPEDARLGGLVWALTSALSLGMRDAGWEFHADPAEGICFTRDLHVVDPAYVMYGLAGGAIDENRWREFCGGCGLSDIPLWPQ